MHLWKPLILPTSFRPCHSKLKGTIKFVTLKCNVFNNWHLISQLLTTAYFWKYKVGINDIILTFMCLWKWEDTHMKTSTSLSSSTPETRFMNLIWSEFFFFWQQTNKKNYLVLTLQKQYQQVCIPLGCVLSAHWSYSLVLCLHGGGSPKYVFRGWSLPKLPKYVFGGSALICI